MSQIIKRNPNLVRGLMLKFLKKIGFGAVDMHFHTQYSMDAISRIKTVLAKVKKTGIGVAITDHNEIKGALHTFKIKMS